MLLCRYLHLLANAVSTLRPWSLRRRRHLETESLPGALQWGRQHLAPESRGEVQAMRRVHLQHPCTKFVEALAIVAAESRIGSLQDRLGQSLERPYEGPLQRSHLVEEHTQAPDVGLVIVRLLPDDLWTQVVRCANTCVGQLTCALEEAHETEVPEECAARAAEENIPRLDVAVDHFLGMDEADRICDLRKALQHRGLLKG
mmetsp:Transcript_70798/g.159026  ORF Transcript_70798/g.159026 Transcript_70798/m.159026 type:complete len:201 (-) Transcript_70798:91-693(-)